MKRILQKMAELWRSEKKNPVVWGVLGGLALWPVFVIAIWALLWLMYWLPWPTRG